MLFYCRALAAGRVEAQPTLMGYSGAGVAQSLYNTVDKAGLWNKYNLDVRAIYFNSGALTAQALVSGDIDLTDSNIPTMLNLKAAGILDVKVHCGMDEPDYVELYRAQGHQDTR